MSRPVVPSLSFNVDSLIYLGDSVKCYRTYWIDTFAGVLSGNSLGFLLVYFACSNQTDVLTRHACYLEVGRVEPPHIFVSCGARSTWCLVTAMFTRTLLTPPLLCCGCSCCLHACILRKSSTEVQKVFREVVFSNYRWWFYQTMTIGLVFLSKMCFLLRCFHLRKQTWTWKNTIWRCIS